VGPEPAAHAGLRDVSRRDRRTVASLASAVGISRSAFAARFTELVGEPAMHYLSRWKMHAALALLKESDAPLSQLNADRDALSSHEHSAYCALTSVERSIARAYGEGHEQSSPNCC
jgi:AraC-like DNA-binding protein